MHETKIIPAILTNDPEKYKAHIAAYQNFATRVHVDISDGTLVPVTTIPTNSIWWPQGWEVDVHMIAARPSDHLATLLQLKPSLCIFHAETEEDLLPIFAKLKEAGIRTGVALMKPTFPGSVKHLIEASDHVLVFAGDLGQQGSVADMLQVEKVSLIRDLKPEVEIAWDGGANLKNTRALAHTGIDAINVGSALSTSENPAETYKALVEETDKRGVVLE